MIGRILIAPFVIIGAIILLIWNEERAKERSDTLNLAQHEVVPMSATNPNPAYLDKLVKISGETVVSNEVEDPSFGIKLKALQLIRKVEQYVEHKDKDGKISHSWQSGNDLDQSNLAGIESENFYPETVTIGKLELSNSFRPNNDDAVVVALNTVKETWSSEYKMVGNYLYYGDPQSPKVGDVRVKFKTTYPGMYSAMGKYGDGDRLATFMMPEGEIHLMQKGSLSVQEMITNAKDANRIMTWILRFVGFILIAAGLNAILSFGGLLTMIPVLNFVTGPIIAFVSGLVALVISCVTIGLSWAFVRPVIGLSLLGVAAAVVVIIFVVRRKVAAK